MTSAHNKVKQPKSAILPGTQRVSITNFSPFGATTTIAGVFDLDKIL
jgi:hypothetical protein